MEHPHASGYRRISTRTNAVNRHRAVSTRAFVSVALAQFVVMVLTGYVLELRVDLTGCLLVENRVATILFLLADQLGIVWSPVTDAHVPVVDVYFTTAFSGQFSSWFIWGTKR